MNRGEDIDVVNVGALVVHVEYEHHLVGCVYAYFTRPSTTEFLKERKPIFLKCLKFSKTEFRGWILCWNTS